MDIKGFKSKDGAVHKYDYGALSNKPENGTGFVVQDTEPDDTSVLWIDPSDDSNDSSQNAQNAQNANIYIGPDKPTDGTLYWLDTSGDNTGDGIEPVAYTVTTHLTSVTIDNTTKSANEGDSYAAAITAADGYVLASVSITMGGVDITGTNYADGNIYIASVTGNVVITATAVEMSEGATTYTITNNLVNVISDNSTVSVEENASYTAKLTPTSGYRLDTVTVTMGGSDVTADTYADGNIYIASVTGNVVIHAIAEVIIVVDEFTPDWITKEFSSETIPYVRTTDVATAVDEFPETLSIVAPGVSNYWQNGGEHRIRYNNYSYENLDNTIATTIAVEGVLYGVLAVTKKDLSDNYNTVLEAGGTVNEFYVKMGNVYTRFTGGEYKLYAGTVDETVIKGLFGV